MKKTLSIFVFMLVVMGSHAQTTSLKGIFNEPYIAGSTCPAIAVFEPLDGHLGLITETPVTKPDYSYHIDLSKESRLMGKILYAGYNGELFPFYTKRGETVTLNVTDFTPTYSKKLSKENKVLATWYGLIAPLHHLTRDKAVTHARPDSVAAIMDKAWQASEAFVKRIKTGNTSFDEEVKFLLPHLFMYEALQVFGMGWCAPNMKLMPKYIQHIFTADNFNHPRVWKTPFTADNILWFTFAKHIICGMKNGQTINYAVDEISDPYVRESYLLYSLEANLVPNPMAFLDKYESIFTMPESKARVAKIRQKCAITVPGNSWIDMEYTDKEGKTHKLSEYLGKVVVIDVWATWCTPCRKELPHLLKLEQEMKKEEKDVVFIGYSIDQDRAAWVEWLNTHDMPKNQLWTGGKGPIVDDYQVRAVPQFIVFSKDGKLISLNAPRPSTPALRELIEKHL